MWKLQTWITSTGLGNLTPSHIIQSFWTNLTLTQPFFFVPRLTEMSTQSSLCTPPQLNSTINTDNQISRALSGAAAFGLQSHLRFLLLYTSWRASTWEVKASSGSYQSASRRCPEQTTASRRTRRWNGNDAGMRWNFKQTWKHAWLGAHGVGPNWGGPWGLSGGKKARITAKCKNLHKRF